LDNLRKPSETIKRNHMPFITPYDKKDTRSGFGDGIFEIAQENDRVVALTADLAGSLKLGKFINAFPERYIQVGIAEANMMGLAAGLTIGGFIPYTTTFANFSTGRVYDQIRQSIAYSGKNVKICASHAGLTLGEDGATHQILEDIGMMRMLPGMTVIVPSDYAETKAATKAIASFEGPVYLRFGRPSWPVFNPADEPFQIGKAKWMKRGTDVCLIACGHMVWKAVEAIELLESRGVNAALINMHTIKPLDEQAVIEAAKSCGAIVTLEEHNRFGGLGEAVSQVLARHYPVPQEYIAVDDSFGESGKPEDLLAKYGLALPQITAAAEAAMFRKQKA